MATITEKQIKDVLATVVDPRDNCDLISKNVISGLIISQDGHVLFTIEVDPHRGADMEDLRQSAEQAVSKIKGIKSVQAVLTAERKPDDQVKLNVLSKPAQLKKNDKSNKPITPHVKHIIAVASGKGGVGKSTIAVNLAMSLHHHHQLRVGLMDADIYGPSIPKMLNIVEKPLQKDDMLIPVEAYGVQTMSMGFLVEPEAPIIWRGPKVQTAVYQFLRDVDWGDLDILVVDMPPGTGDAQLTMAQKVPLSGAVIVSTPQDIALLDAVKGVNMFRRVHIPILGMVENMSQFCCPNCDHISTIFGHAGAQSKARELQIDNLGQMPLHQELCQSGEDGQPFIIKYPNHPITQSFADISFNIKEKLAL